MFSPQSELSHLSEQDSSSQELFTYRETCFCKDFEGPTLQTLDYWNLCPREWYCCASQVCNTEVVWTNDRNALKQELGHASRSDGIETLIDAGDEIRLQHNCCGLNHQPWAGVGNVIKLSDTSEEIMVELKGHAPTTTTVGWTAEFVWKSTSFDRMQRAMRLFAVDDTSMSSYLYHRWERVLMSCSSGYYFCEYYRLYCHPHEIDRAVILYQNSIH